MFWLNGALLAGPTASFDLTDRGLLLGDGVFDTSLVLNGRMVFAERHFERLFAALALLDIAADPSAIRQAAEALSAGAERAVLRITVTRGPGPRGLKAPSPQRPTILAACSPLPETLFFSPLSLDVSAIRRNETSPLSQLKTLGYLDAILAYREAAARGHDEALFLNTKGHVACAATGNIFAVFGSEIVTPPLSDGILPGIIRGFFLDESYRVHLKAVEASLDPDDLMAADCVFVTNSLRLIAPVTRIGAAVLASRADEPMAALKVLLWQSIAREARLDGF